MADRTQRSTVGSSQREQQRMNQPYVNRFEPDQLWSSRAAAFRGELKPYVGYMAQSGFPGVMMLMLILATVGYAALVRDLPAHFPVTLFGVALVIGFTCWSPLRTWLQPADTVFLLPRELEMHQYLRRSFRYTGIPTLIGVWFSLLAYWPMYEHGEGTANAAVLLLALAALKAGNIAGAWQERRTAEPGARRFLRFLRWVLTGVTLAALFRLEPWKAILFGLLAAALMAVIYRLPRKHALPWETLIREEIRTRRRYYRFLALFIDVPTQAPRIARRSYAAWIGRAIKFAQRETYVYLYTMTLLRTELGGMLIRLTLLGMLVLYWLGDAAWLDGWGSTIVFVLVAGIIGLQLGSLRHSHKYAVWGHLYPLPAQRRIDSLATVDRMAYIVCTLLMWLPGGIALAVHGNPLQALAAPAAALLYGMLRRPSVVRRKALKDDEED
ncbi:ABC-2 type transport system permease protein [Paenibacillus cellulosilyticus]|uniref:ABC-2 type transport system permease protein n=1 Tax=Paenibacillus cellulosilyticus TaxID=375489 RepID=A0A2V2YYN7_9BACL|nr:ABC transporter permease [Paenibacillus cellulosilyticus]PWW07383.1 ABC-2 type transport system permease protein [Paenibacillus cellulosilyticus]QKS44449.1 ABC transporter permease [Paenibacillus cellulosilyticus]